MMKLQLLSQVLVTGPGATVQAPPNEVFPFLRSYQAGLVGGTAAVVDIELSDDAKTWITAATFTLAPDTAEGVSSEVPWRFIRANVIAISGGGGAVDALVTLGNAG